MACYKLCSRTTLEVVIPSADLVPHLARVSLVLISLLTLITWPVL